MRLWKITCQEDKYPGMWQRWFLHQCAAVGWHSKLGYKLEGKTKPGYGWIRARKSLLAIQMGDRIVVTLRGNRVGPIGEVTGKAISDSDWNPLVPRSTLYPMVRWAEG